MYKTLLLMLCMGASTHYQDNDQGIESKFNKVVVFGNHRESILFNGAYMPMIDMKNNLFKIDYTFYLDKESIRYTGTFNYVGNILILDELRTDQEGRHSRISVNAVCKAPHN